MAVNPEPVNLGDEGRIILHDSDDVQDIIIERATLQAWLDSLPPQEEPKWQDHLWVVHSIAKITARYLFDYDARR